MRQIRIVINYTALERYFDRDSVVFSVIRERMEWARAYLSSMLVVIPLQVWYLREKERKRERERE